MSVMSSIWTIIGGGATEQSEHETDLQQSRRAAVSGHQPYSPSPNSKFINW
jgi:hypothetical protein